MTTTESVPEVDVWSWTEDKNLDLESLLALKKAILTHPPLRNELEKKLAGLGDAEESRRVTGLAYWLLARYERAHPLLADCNVQDRVVRYALADCCLKARVSDRGAYAMRRPDLAADLLAKHPDVDKDLRVFALHVDALLFDNKMKEVKAALEAAPQTFRDTAPWAYFQGRLAEDEGEYRTARSHYLKALEKDPGHRPALLRLAYQHDLGGDDEQALDYYKRLASLRPLDLHALINYGVLLEDHNRYTEAIACYRQILAVHPNHSRARNYLKDASASLNMTFDEESERRVDKRNQILRIPISDFELSVRARNCLAKMGVETLGDLVTRSEQELLSYKNFGETSLSEIKVLLESKGLRLGMNLNEDPMPVPTEAPERPRQPVELPPGVDPTVLDKVLADLELSVRVRKALAQLKVVTLGDLIQRRESELLSLKNFGQTSLTELKGRLAEFGVDFQR